MAERKSLALALLRQALDDPKANFRQGQWESIESLVYHHDRLLLVQRTGWGKSIVYFLTTRLQRDAGSGPTIIISPLLSLIRNQIEAAERLGLTAVSINSDNRDDWENIENRFLNKAIDVLLVSPERLADNHFRRDVLVPAMNRFGLGLFVVDEAHCISDWGHDFRPDYRRITRIIQALPETVPVLATTATANDRVVRDIQTQLGERLQVVRGPLARHSLRLQNIVMPSQAERLAWLAHYVPKLPGSGIIYTLTVRDAERVASWLQSQGINAEAYYGGRKEGISRPALEQALLNNELKALVATTALGMGFDKPDLGFVIHYQRPGSVVHYYQQVGRAGRAIKRAYAILMSGEEDQDILDYFVKSAFPAEGHAEKVLTALADSDGLSISQLTQSVNLGWMQIEKVLNLLSVLSPSPVEKEGKTWYRTLAPYKPDREEIEHLTALRYAEQEQMEAYLTSTSCLMQFLLEALDAKATKPCGVCAVCRGKEIVSTQLEQMDVEAANQFLARQYIVIQPKKVWPGRNAFPTYGWPYKIAEDLRFEEGRALCRWSDSGLGLLVKQGKQQYGQFDLSLVDASLKLIQRHWQPDPFPTWVTCVPSNNHPNLVPEFARHLARKLGLPFHPCVQKARETQAQKLMQNRFQQARNLDGAFRIEALPNVKGPVLLVDDIIDSGMTIAVVSALLREAGSGPVYPLALADSSHRK